MSGKYLLDTNIIIALFANEAAVLEKLQRAKEIFISNITIVNYITVLKNREELEKIKTVLMSWWQIVSY